MEAAGMFAVVKFKGSEGRSYLPVESIPKFKMPVNCMKQFIMIDRDGERRTGRVLALYDTEEQAKVKAAATGRTRTPPQYLISEASELSEDDNDATQLSSLLTQTQSKVSLVQATRRQKQMEQLSVLQAKGNSSDRRASLPHQKGPKAPEATSTTALSQQMKSKKTFKDNSPDHTILPQWKIPPAGTTSDGHATSSQRKKTKGAGVSSSSVAAHKRDSKAISNEPLSAGTHTKSAATARHNIVTEEENSNTSTLFKKPKEKSPQGTRTLSPTARGNVESGVSEESTISRSQVVKRKDDADPPALKKKCLDDFTPDMFSDTDVLVGEIIGMCGPLHHRGTSRTPEVSIESLQRELAVVREENRKLQSLNLALQDDIITSMKEFFSSQKSACTTSAAESSGIQAGGLSETPVEGIGLWEPVDPPGPDQRIHLGFGVTLNARAHKRILFYSENRSASVYVRSLAEEVLGAKTVMSKTVKQLDPTIILALRESHRHFLMVKRSLKGINLEMEIAKFNAHMHSAKGDLRKAQMKAQKKSQDGEPADGGDEVEPADSDDGEEVDHGDGDEQECGNPQGNNSSEEQEQPSQEELMETCDGVLNVSVPSDADDTQFDIPLS